MVTRGGRAQIIGCPRPGWPLMSESWGKVTTSWWLEQAGVGQKARAAVGSKSRPRERKQLMEGNQPENEMSYVDGRHGKF